MTGGSAEPQVRVHESADALADAVAAALVDVLATAQAAGRVPQVALTGGTVAGSIHRRVRDLSAGRVDWSQVELWWGDERFVPVDDEDRNARQAAEALLDHVPVDPARVHPMPASDGGHGGLQEAAQVYGDEVRGNGSGSFDVVMLGVGPDGHVASLFPGYPQLDRDDVIAVAVTDSPKPPPDRITLTLPALNRSRQVWFVVSGDAKAEAVGRALGEPTPDVHEIPAAGVRGEDATIWFLDQDAASHL